MAIATVGNIEIVVRTRDEHCPPHVHADCAPEGWDARFRFSFLDDEVAYWDTRPARNAPTIAVLNRVGATIHANLPACRRRWWEAKRTTCLVNQHVRVAGQVLVPCEASVVGALRITSAVYNPAGTVVIIVLSDGTTRLQTP